MSILNFLRIKGKIKLDIANVYFEFFKKKKRKLKQTLPMSKLNKIRLQEFPFLGIFKMK